jgi:acyl-CoA thioesterase
VGRAVSTVQCEISTRGEVAAMLLGVYGGARETSVHVPLTGSPPARPLDQIKEVVLAFEGAPRFLQHFDVRWIEGPALFSGTRTAGRAFIRHRDPAPMTESHVVALSDCLPTPAMSMYSAPAPASSLTWTLEFLDHTFDFGMNRWWRVEHDIDAAKEGYVSQTGVLYNPNGVPAALSRQLVAIFG